MNDSPSCRTPRRRRVSVSSLPEFQAAEGRSPLRQLYPSPVRQKQWREWEFDTPPRPHRTPSVLDVLEQSPGTPPDWRRPTAPPGAVPSLFTRWERVRRAVGWLLSAVRGKGPRG